MADNASVSGYKSIDPALISRPLQGFIRSILTNIDQASYYAFLPDYFLGVSIGERCSLDMTPTLEYAILRYYETSNQYTAQDERAMPSLLLSLEDLCLTLWVFKGEDH